MDGQGRKLAPSDIFDRRNVVHADFVKFQRNETLPSSDRRAVKHGSRGLQPTVTIVSEILSHCDNGTRPQRSPQQVTLIHRQVVQRYKLPVFVLERRLGVVLPLAGDVLDRVRHLRLPNGKRSVSILPRKPLHGRPLAGNPFRRLAFKTSHPFAESHRCGQADQEMNVVLHTTDMECLYPVGSAYSAQVAPNALFDVRSDPSFTVLGRENEMQVDRGVGVRHARNDGFLRTLFLCRSATQSLSSPVRGLMPTATVLDRSAVEEARVTELPKARIQTPRPLKPTATVLDRSAVDSFLIHVN